MSTSSRSCCGVSKEEITKQINADVCLASWSSNTIPFKSALKHCVNPPYGFNEVDTTIHLAIRLLNIGMRYFTIMNIRKDALIFIR